MHWRGVELSTPLLLGMLAAFCIGMSKAGFSGISLVSVFLLADLFGATVSVGLALPLLIFADVMVYPQLRQHGSWKAVWALLPATLAGLGLGWWCMRGISEGAAKDAIGYSIVAMVLLQGLRSWKPEWVDRMAQSRGFGTFAGVLGGVTTMLANAAGPVIHLYLLSRRLPKMELVGIGARFFLLVNLLKLPLTGQLELISEESLWWDLKLAPAVLLGIWCGKRLITRVSQRVFEWMILGFSLLSAARLILF